jgi:peptide/nickel transport system substrate-binding protein
MSRRVALRGLGLTMAAGTIAALVGCSSGTAKPESGAASPPAGTGGTGAAQPAVRARVERLRLAGGQWGYPSPFAYNRGPGLAHALFMFDTLTWKDGSGNVIPWLATKSEARQDGLQYTYTLHEKATWHDGTPLTAEDVAFTFDYFSNGPGKTASGVVGRIDFISKVSVVDARTVRFDLARPYAPFDVLLAGRVPIIPKAVWSSVNDPAKYRDKKALLGSGPWRADSIDDSAGTYRYVANDTHFLGAPHVKALEFLPTSDELGALEQGTLDGAGAPSEDGIPEGALRPFEGKEWATLEGPGEWHRSFHINLNKPFPFNDTAFRQALAYSIDRKDMVKRLLLGRGEPGSLGGLAPSHPMSAPDLPAYHVDVAKAKALLDGIGIKDTNGDGIRELPGGARFNPELQTSSRYSPKTAELIKEYLRAVGIDLKITGLDSNTADANAARGNYELALVGYGGLGGDPDGLRTRFSSRSPGQAFSRAIGFKHAKFEELADQQITRVNPEERKAVVQEMQRVLAAEVPQISLYLPARLHIYRKSVFDAWYYTPGGVFGGYPGVLNKHSFFTGKTTGF